MQLHSKGVLRTEFHQGGAEVHTCVLKHFVAQAQRKITLSIGPGDSFGDFYEVSLCVYFVPLCSKDSLGVVLDFFN
jgi:hypothetical protein